MYGIKLGLPHVPDKNFNLGLDLQGGAHLIYQARTDQIVPIDRGNAVEGVRDVIERRVRGGLGVAEPLVQTTRVGESYRIIVELPGVTDVNQAIKMIGETPVLEFKEQNNEPLRDLTANEKKELDAFNAGQEKKAAEAAGAVRKGQKFEEVVARYSEDEKSKSKGGDLGFVAFDTYPDLYNWAKTQKIGQASPSPVKSFDGLNVVKLAAVRDGGKRVNGLGLLGLGEFDDFLRKGIDDFGRDDELGKEDDEVVLFRGVDSSGRDGDVVVDRGNRREMRGRNVGD